MSVIFQYASKVRRERAAEVKPAFDEFEGVLTAQPGFERARLFVNQSTLQVQVLLYWKTHAEGVAFNAGAYRQMAVRLLPLMEREGTLIASMLECEVVADTREG